jgi:hypothetical protein
MRAGDRRRRRAGAAGHESDEDKTARRDPRWKQAVRNAPPQGCGHMPSVREHEKPPKLTDECARGSRRAMRAKQRCVSLLEVG